MYINKTIQILLRCHYKTKMFILLSESVKIFIIIRHSNGIYRLTFELQFSFMRKIM